MSREADREPGQAPRPGSGPRDLPSGHEGGHRPIHDSDSDGEAGRVRGSAPCPHQRPNCAAGHSAAGHRARVGVRMGWTLSRVVPCRPSHPRVRRPTKVRGGAQIRNVGATAQRRSAQEVSGHDG